MMANKTALVLLSSSWLLNRGWIWLYF